MNKLDEILEALRQCANPDHVAGMARFGINPKDTLGISIPTLRKLAKQYKPDHELAQQLWASGIHEARILASMIDDPQKVTPEQMDTWASQFDSWDVCDQVCLNLFDKTPYAYTKAVEWSEKETEFLKRAGFALMASLAFHDKSAPNAAFEAFFPIILRHASDERNFVKKAVNWALRQIGKRNRYLQQRAIEVAQQMATLDSKAARWNAKDTLRELNQKNLPN
ncbi:MAG: DNA alkylation repair protein, partial [Anaerolineales bacterium]|nr:DNA alkylation repair protein [Anaerolineales bacterium]